MGAEEHYEILILQRSGWILDSIVFDRKAALSYAAGLSEIEGFAAVKVVYSVFSPGSGLFREGDVQLLDNPGGQIPDRRGAHRPLSVRVPPGEAGRVCAMPDDLHTAEARRIIAAVLGSHLNGWMITPLELLHLPQHALRLHEAGTVMQGAVQRAAVMLSHQGAGPAAGVVKKLYDVIGAATRRLQEESVVGTPDPERLRYRRLAERLVGAGSWAEKIDRLFTSLPALSTEEDLRPVDRLAAEMLSLGGGLSALLRVHAGLPPEPPAQPGAGAAEPPPRPLVAIVSDLLDLLDLKGTAAGADIAGAGIRRLLALLRLGQLPDCFDTLLGRVARELEGPRFLVGSIDTTALDLEREARAIGDVASRVGLLAGRSGGGAEAAVIIALENRSEALLRPEVLGTHLGRDPAANVALLLTISRHLVGDLNQSRIAKHLLATIASADAIAHFAKPGGSGVLGRLRRLAAWQEEVDVSAFPAELRQRLIDALDSVSQAIITKSGLYALLARSKPNPMDQALAIADLVRTHALTRGGVLEGARARALACIDSAGGFEAFATELFERSVSFERITTISRFLGTGSQP